MNISDVLDAREVPPPPGPTMRLLELRNDPDAGIDDLVGVVTKDAALAAKIVATANSPVYRRGDAVTSLERAVRVLGFRSVTTTALALSVASTIPTRGLVAGIPMTQYWTRSVLTAGAARLVATEVQKDLAEEAFFVGLVAHLGRVIVALTQPDRYERLTLAHQGWPPAEAERDAFGFSSMAVTGALLTQWGMPALLARAAEMVETVGASEPTGDDEEDLARIVHLATLITSFLVEQGDGIQLQALVREAKVTGISAHIIDRLVDEVFENIEDLAHEFEVPADETTYAQIIADARAELVDLSIQTDMEWHAERDKRQELEAAAEKLRSAALKDPLTGLGNRRAFDEQLGRQLSHRMRHPGAVPKQLGVIMLDLDDFKAVNDTHGHDAGDAVLKKVAEVLDASTRAHETIARYGGEEFVLLVPSGTEEELALAGERLRATVEQIEIEIPSGEIVSITASFGAAALDRVVMHDDGPSLIKAADEALYEAKEGGRNRVVVATDWR